MGLSKEGKIKNWSPREESKTMFFKNCRYSTSRRVLSVVRPGAVGPCPFLPRRRTSGWGAGRSASSADWGKASGSWVPAGMAGVGRPTVEKVPPRPSNC